MEVYKLFNQPCPKHPDSIYTTLCLHANCQQRILCHKCKDIHHFSHKAFLKDLMIISLQDEIKEIGKLIEEYNTRCNAEVKELEGCFNTLKMKIDAAFQLTKLNLITKLNYQKHQNGRDELEFFSKDLEDMRITCLNLEDYDPSCLEQLRNQFVEYYSRLTKKKQEIESDLSKIVRINFSEQFIRNFPIRKFIDTTMQFFTLTAEKNFENTFDWRKYKLKNEFEFQINNELINMNNEFTDKLHSIKNEMLNNFAESLHENNIEQIEKYVMENNLSKSSILEHLKKSVPFYLLDYLSPFRKLWAWNPSRKGSKLVLRDNNMTVEKLADSNNYDYSAIIGDLKMNSGYHKWILKLSPGAKNNNQWICFGIVQDTISINFEDFNRKDICGISTGGSNYQMSGATYFTHEDSKSYECVLDFEQDIFEIRRDGEVIGYKKNGIKGNSFIPCCILCRNNNMVSLTVCYS